MRISDWSSDVGSSDLDESIRTLVADMFETMHAAPGVGLAAPQVGESLRLFVWHWAEDESTLHEGVAINPALWITPTELGPPDADERSEERRVGKGCVSTCRSRGATLP